jgi:hypothetical protein
MECLECRAYEVCYVDLPRVIGLFTGYIRTAAPEGGERPSPPEGAGYRDLSLLRPLRTSSFPSGRLFLSVPLHPSSCASALPPPKGIKYKATQTISRRYSFQKISVNDQLNMVKFISNAATP